ncbi:glycogen synthase GlgA [Frateuria aurantia]
MRTDPAVDDASDEVGEGSACSASQYKDDPSHYRCGDLGLKRGRHVLFVTSEITDFVKSGGLGDVSAALPRAMRDSEDVRVLVPGYAQLMPSCAERGRWLGQIPAYAGLPACAVVELVQADGLRIWVLVCPELFAGDGSPYADDHGCEWPDIALRFATLSHAAAEIMLGHCGLPWVGELLHLNDWPGAMAAAYLHWAGSSKPVVLTIHNLAYQGLFPLEFRHRLGLPEHDMASYEHHGRLSFLRAGITHADQLTTVSRSYANQITLPMHGCGLDELLRERAIQGRLTGIVNGIDGSWNPVNDPHLQHHFSLGDLRGKQANAEAMRSHFKLKPSSGPLFAVVSRLVHQKGIDLICGIAPQLIHAGGQLIIIGGGEPLVEQAVQRLAHRYPGHVGIYVGFSEGLSRQMLAGADFLLMPSRFEPCGLSQMYAQRFGCLPIAHATGGLLDTVDDGVTGFLFESATLDSFRRSLQRAFYVYRMHDLLAAMRCAAMLQSHGWDQARDGYLSVYQRMAPRRNLVD